MAKSIMDLPDLRGIDFIDFGASGGGSLQWGRNTFGAEGLGIDIDPAKVAKTTAAGFRAVEADATNLAFPKDAVSFSIISDFVEHLRSREYAAHVIANAFRVSRDFVFIAYPDFDNEEFLRERDLKRYYTDWSGHTLHLGTAQLAAITSNLRGKSHISRFGEIFDSFDRVILPASAPRNSSFYDPSSFASKPFIKFPRKTIYTRVLCLVLKSDRFQYEALMLKILYSLGYLRRIK